MHEIQEHILSKLIHQTECRYRDLKPKEVDGNLFMYHLRQLFKDGLVEKGEKLYRLTPRGLQYADTLSLKTLKPRSQPKIVTVVGCQNDHGDWLLYKRTRQPYFGLRCFPYGKIHLGETVGEAAERELLEKTGLMAELEHRGEAYITTLAGEELVGQMLCHVFTGRNPIGKLKRKTDVGESTWQKMAGLTEQDLLPGFLELYRLIERPSKERFFEEIVVKTSA